MSILIAGAGSGLPSRGHRIPAGAPGLSMLPGAADIPDPEAVLAHQVLTTVLWMSRRTARIAEGPYDTSVDAAGRKALQAAAAKLAKHPEKLLEKVNAGGLTQQDFDVKARVLARAIWRMEGALAIDDPLSAVDVETEAGSPPAGDPLTNDDAMNDLLAQIYQHLAGQTIPVAVTRDRKMYVVRAGNAEMGSVALARRTRLSDARGIADTVGRTMREVSKFHRRYHS